MKNMFIAALCFAVALSGCGSDDAAPNVGGDVLGKYGLQAVGEPVITSASLPTDFTDVSWSQKSAACREAGYDMTSYAGQNVTVIRYSLKEKYSYRVLAPVPSPFGGIEGTEEIVGDLPLHLWVVVRGQETVCGYVSVSDPDMVYLNLLAQGFFPSPFMAVNDEHIQ